MDKKIKAGLKVGGGGVGGGGVGWVATLIIKNGGIVLPGIKVSIATAPVLIIGCGVIGTALVGTYLYGKIKGEKKKEVMRF